MKKTEIAQNKNRKLYESIMRSVAQNVKKVINESFDDEDDPSNGWDEETLYNLKHVLATLQNLNYEIESCYRGAYTKCETYAQLGEYVENLANELLDVAEDLKSM